ncbi:hypothetical protein ACET3Z_030270 [Daucus carota]
MNVFIQIKLLKILALLGSGDKQSDSHNLKYMGIDALGRLIKISANIVEHQLAGVEVSRKGETCPPM